MRDHTSGSANVRMRCQPPGAGLCSGVQPPCQQRHRCAQAKTPGQPPWHTAWQQVKVTVDDFLCSMHEHLPLLLPRLRRPRRLKDTKPLLKLEATPEAKLFRFFKEHKHAGTRKRYLQQRQSGRPEYSPVVQTPQVVSNYRRLKWPACKGTACPLRVPTAGSCKTKLLLCKCRDT